jgi:hypothetical protein
MPADGPPRRAPGRGLAGAVVAGFVSLVLGFHAGGFAGALAGPLVFAAAGVAVAVAAWLLQRRLRRSARGRLLWTLAIVLHVGFWSARGVATTTFREPGAVERATVAAWEGEPRSFLAGVGERPFDVPEGTPIAGWGRGRRRAAWPHAFGAGPVGRASIDAMAGRRPFLVTGERGAERLGARALVLRPEDGGGPPLAICRLDLVVSDARLHREVARRIAHLGYAPETVLLPATHTHSGPGGYVDLRLACVVGTDHFDPAVFERVAAAAAGAIADAHARAVPARLGFVASRDRGPDGHPALAKNRRGARERRDRVDDEVLGIRVDAREGEGRIALLLNYAVHPTWLRHRSRVFSKDVAGALEASEAIADGATVLFVNGAEGDVAPRVGPTTEGGRPLAAFEAAVASDLSPRATADRLRVVASTVRRDLGSARAFVCAGGRARFRPAAESPLGDGVAGAAAGLLALPANVVAWSAGFDPVRAGFTFDGSAGVVAALDPYLDDGTAFSFGAVRLETPEARGAIVWAPVEATHTVGFAAKAKARLRGAAPVLLFGLTNGAMGYCASPEEYDEGGYEALCTLFGRGTSDLLLECADAALEAAGFRDGGSRP